MTATIEAPARSNWMISRPYDVLVAFAWIPFSIAAVIVLNDVDHIRAVMGATFALSAAHQPLTLPLVYGDPALVKKRRSLYSWSPFVMIALVVIGLQISFGLVAIVAGSWNAVHTLQQRYGITRIYGRKSNNPNGRLDRALLWSWFGAAIVWTSASGDLPEQIDKLGFGRRNRRGADLLVDAEPVTSLLLPLVLIGVAWITVKWLKAERSYPRNWARWTYVGSTGLLMVVIAVSPIVGFIGYVGSHAVEYFIVVKHRLDKAKPDDPSPIAKTVRSKLGPVGAIVIFTAVFVAMMSVLKAQSSTVYFAIFLTIGGLHIFYDGFIWKLRTKEVADQFSLPNTNTT
jgi:hypothetical protein